MRTDDHEPTGTTRRSLSRRRSLKLIGAAAFVAASAATVNTSYAADVTLSYAMWDQAQVPAMNQIIGEFHKAHPNIYVQIQLTPWTDYWTKLQTAATGGSAPDVFWMTVAYFKYYAAGGVLMPLDDQI